MKTRMHVLYIPGLGDAHPVGQILAVQAWHFWGVEAELLQMQAALEKFAESTAHQPAYELKQTIWSTLENINKEKAGDLSCRRSAEESNRRKEEREVREKIRVPKEREACETSGPRTRRQTRLAKSSRQKRQRIAEHHRPAIENERAPARSFHPRPKRQASAIARRDGRFDGRRRER